MGKGSVIINYSQFTGNSFKSFHSSISFCRSQNKLRNCAMVCLGNRYLKTITVASFSSCSLKWVHGAYHQFCWFFIARLLLCSIARLCYLTLVFAYAPIAYQQDHDNSGDFKQIFLKHGIILRRFHGSSIYQLIIW